MTRPIAKPEPSATPRTEAFAESCATYSALRHKIREGGKADLRDSEFILAIEHARILERALAAMTAERDAATVAALREVREMVDAQRVRPIEEYGSLTYIDGVEAATKTIDAMIAKAAGK